MIEAPSRVDAERVVGRAGLPVQAIFHLLLAASNPECPSSTRNNIHGVLAEAALGFEEGEIAGTEDDLEFQNMCRGVKAALDSFYVETIKYNPTYLPKLLPAFAALCGVRDEGTVVANINWDEINMLMRDLK